MTAYEALTLMVSFGTFVVALVALMITIVKRKVDRPWQGIGLLLHRFIAADRSLCGVCYRERVTNTFPYLV